MLVTILFFPFSYCQRPQVEMHFFVELYEVTAGAAINDSARFAQVKFLQSDEPQSLMYFSVGSRLPVAHKKATLVSLQVARDSGTGLMMTVNFSTQVSMEYRLTHIKVFFFNYSMCYETGNNWYIIFWWYHHTSCYVYYIKLYPWNNSVFSLRSCFKMIVFSFFLSFDKVD